MNINLKQNAIIKGITLYLVSQGINVSGKAIDVTFTSGRKGTGLSADVSIEDSDAQQVTHHIPGFSDADGEPMGNQPKPTAVDAAKVDAATAPFDVVQPDEDKVEISNPAAEAAAVEDAEPVLLNEALEDFTGEKVVEEAQPKKTKNSLFGN